MLGSLKADWKVKINRKSIHAWRGSTGCSCGLWSGSALSEPSTAGPARAKRRGCLSAASSRAVPRRAEERRAPMRSIGSW